MTALPPLSKSDNIPLTVGTIVATVFALSLGDALIKSLGGDNTLGLWQLFAVRSLLALPVLFVGALILLGANRHVPHQIGWITAGAVLLTVMWLSYYLSILHLPLVIAVAAYYTLPLFIVAFAAMLYATATVLTRTKC